MATSNLKEIEKMFEIVGLSKDYYIDSKFIGSEKLAEPDREVGGYEGRRKEVVNVDITFKKKKIKAGTTVTTEMCILCGKAKTEGIKLNTKA